VVSPLGARSLSLGKLAGGVIPANASLPSMLPLGMQLPRSDLWGCPLSSRCLVSGRMQDQVKIERLKAGWVLKTGHSAS